MLRVTPFPTPLWPLVVALAAIVVGCGGRTDVSAAPGADAGSQGAMLSDGVVPEASDSADATSCIIVVASDYDQSCSLDTDCVAVPQKPECPPSCWNCSFSVAINKNAYPRYHTALLQVFASEGPPCNCPALSPTACCRSGSCQTACSTPADVLPACAAVHGACLYNDILNPPTCAWAGPPNSCAYPDETCCRSLR